jgi:hypothetical protein
MFRRFRAAVTGRDARERMASIERLVRKLGDAQREQAETLQARVAALSETMAQQPTAKDLRELRQAVRALSVGARTDQDRALVETLEGIASSTRPILIGPWTGEVGFELLYWIPFIEWARTHFGWAREREIIVSRGGVASWYGHGPASYEDVFSLVPPQEFHAELAEERRKRRRPGAFDERVIEAVTRRRGLARDQLDLLHPGQMFRAFAPYWSDEAGYGRIDQFTRHRLLTPPMDAPPDLPPTYVAVRFYFSECFPETPENRAFAHTVVSALAERTPVVILNPGFTMDDHHDWSPDARARVATIANGLPPDRNLAVQSAVVSGARAFVGTYGGYSYLAPLYGVPAISFYSRQTFKLHHLHAAQRAFEPIGAAMLMPLDVAQASLVQLALGTLVPA